MHLHAGGRATSTQGGVELACGGRRRRTGPGPSGTGRRRPRPDGDRTQAASTDLPRRHRARVEGRAARACAGRRWSARRRSTCRAGSGPCRPGRTSAAGPGERDGRRRARRAPADHHDVGLDHRPVTATELGHFVAAARPPGKMVRHEHDSVRDESPSSPVPGRGIGREHALIAGPPGRQGRRQRPRRQRRRHGRRPQPGAAGRRGDQGDGRRGRRQRRRRRRRGRAPSAWSTPPSRRSATSHVLVNNAGILRDRMLINMTEEEWDAVIKVHLKGTFAPGPLGRRLLAGAGQGGQAGRRPHHQHHVGVGHLRQPRPDQLRRGQGRHRRVHDHRRARARPLRRHGQRHRARSRSPA